MYIEDGESMITFNSTTQMHLYHNYEFWNENSRWFKIRRLSRNRLEFDNTINCNAMTFDRIDEGLKVRQVGTDRTAFADWEQFCPEQE